MNTVEHIGDNMEYETSKITVAPDRQRKEFSTEDLNSLRESIRRRGIYSPIIIHSDGILIAGERRLRCARELNLPTVPVRIYENLSLEDQEAIQLEENIRRKDLTWQEEAIAFYKIHKMLKAKNPTQTQTDSADYLGTTPTELSRQISIAVYLERDPVKIVHCTTASAAYNIIMRLRERAIEREAGKASPSVAATLETIFKHEDAPETTVADTILRPPPRETEQNIFQRDFMEFATTYSGEPFNFIHCDFPYGVNIHKSDQMQSESWGAYQDSPEIFWRLTNTLFENADRVVAQQAHILFWFSMEYYTPLIQLISLFSSFRANPFPLIWSKSDGSGVLPDPKRGPRRTYETALLITRGDRQIVKPINNSHSAPLGAKSHLSEKPQPVLRHFLSMLLDETSTVLDPSCGSGNALAVAEEFKVRSVMGLDIDPKSVELAESVLRRARLYKRMAEVKLD